MVLRFCILSSYFYQNTLDFLKFMILIIFEIISIFYFCSDEKHFKLFSCFNNMFAVVFKGKRGIGMENKSKIHHRESLRK